MNGKKISAGAAGGAIAVIICWVVEEFAKVTIPAEVAASGATLLTIIASALIPDEMEA
jgi:hypothetical protein